ncbi:MAG: hypothetical protein FRX48_06339 [Lasallia pustulata]|uniref:SWI5-dependent HO expression protein 3 n=1 Tax=Lasallia pustulata TaxID=136370 RepID=A0A1W5DCI6_9LECA|nr:MAG: hypothetical protein FRX48_06339 [Lasallia pustulata]SLM40690.1 hypothetical protein LPUS_11529 [Lasallia pustulata]
MKSGQGSPQPDLFQLRAYRFNKTAEPPKIHLGELFSSSMSLNGLNGFLSEPVTPSRQNGTSPAPSIGAQRFASHGSDTPTGIHSITVNSFSSPPASEPCYSTRLSPVASGPGTSSNELQGIPWSSAVGRATTGKSGRVIERLMADNDRLQRELTLSNAKNEEEAKRSEWAKSTLESLRATNENLHAMQEVDKAALLRKDRKIEELRADLEAEKARRAQAENETRETVRERDEAVGKFKKQIMEEKEVARKSTSQYEILSSSWRSLDDGYRRRTQKLKADVKDISHKREEDVQKIEQLEIVVEQLKRESEKMAKVKEQVLRDFEDYKREKEAGMREIRKRAERNESANEEALGEMNRVMGEMKYVINIKRDVRGAE